MVAVNPGAYICREKKKIIVKKKLIQWSILYLMFSPDVEKEKEEAKDDGADCDGDEERHVLDTAVNIIWKNINSHV